MTYSSVIEISEEDFELAKTTAKPVSGGPRVVEISSEEFEAEKKGIKKQQKNLAQPGNSRSPLAVEAEQNLEQFQQNVGQSFAKRIQQASDILREEGPYQGPTNMFDMENEGLTTTGKFIGLAGSMAGLGWDLFGDVYTLATDGYSLIIPDEMEDAAKAQYREGVQAFVEHPLGKKAQAALEAGTDAWVEFKKENPEMALVVESVFNVSGWLRRGPDAKPVSIDRESGFDPNVRFYDPAARQLKDMTTLEKGIWRVIRPPKSAEQTNKQTTAPQGPMRVQQTVLTPDERRRVDTVKRLARVDPSRTDRTNAKSIQEAVTKMDEKLKKLLERRKDPVYHLDLVKNIEMNLKQWIAKNQGLGEKRLIEESKKAMAQLNEALGGHPQTALGMLDARRELDSWVRKNLGADTLKRKEGKKGAIARDEIYTIIRRSMNDMLDTGDSNAANRMLRDESDLLAALDAINSRVPQGDTIMARIRDNLGALNIHMPSTPLGQVALASSATNPKFFPFFAGLVSTYTGYGLTKKAWSKAYYNKELRLILESLGEGIKTATNPEMAKQLRADRAAIIEVYKGYMEDVEEDENE